MVIVNHMKSLKLQPIIWLDNFSDHILFCLAFSDFDLTLSCTYYRCVAEVVDHPLLRCECEEPRSVILLRPFVLSNWLWFS